MVEKKGQGQGRLSAAQRELLGVLRENRACLYFAFRVGSLMVFSVGGLNVAWMKKHNERLPMASTVRALVERGFLSKEIDQKGNRLIFRLMEG